MTPKPVFAGWLRVLLFTTFFFAVAIGVASLALTWFKNQRAQRRVAALSVTMQRAKPLIAAIKKYRAEHGVPPSSMPDLYPGYLSNILPAGPIAKYGWLYNSSPRAEMRQEEWTLSIRVRDEYSPNLMGFGDTFAFHPSGRYPRAAYGGSLVPVGDWGYYVE